MVMDKNGRSHKPQGLPQRVAGTYDVMAGVGTDSDLAMPTPNPTEHFTTLPDAQQVLPYQVDRQGFNTDSDSYDYYQISNETIREDFAHILANDNSDLTEEQALDWVNNHSEDMYRYMAVQQLHDLDIESIDPQVLDRITEQLQEDIDDQWYTVGSFEDVENHAAYLLYEELDDALREQYHSQERVLPAPDDMEENLIGYDNDGYSASYGALEYASVTPIFLTKDAGKRVQEVGYEQAYAESELPEYLQELNEEW